MLVKELIEKLKEMPQDRDILHIITSQQMSEHDYSISTENVRGTNLMQVVYVS